jgi:dTDP-4-dehydrorhamnose reductase
VNSAARRILITGAAGMLGRQLFADAPADVQVIGTDLLANSGIAAPGVDLADEAQVGELWNKHGPFEAVIHGAAYTAVDLAETNVEIARRANVGASEVLARRCARERTRLVAVSTDFVFDGALRRPYREEDPPRPLSVYGSTKLDGERALLAAHPSGCLIARTQWLYGPHGKHFPRTIVAAAREKGRLKVVDDQRGSPTTTLALTPALWELTLRGEPGIYHAACDGECSWYEFTRAILDELGLASVVLEPCSSAEFPRPARRPAYSVLGTERDEAPVLPPWQDGVAAYLSERAVVAR